MPPPDVTRLHRRLTERRARLNDHVTALHRKHRPWDVTAFQAQTKLLSLPEAAKTSVRLRPLDRLDDETAEHVRDDLREYAELDGLTSVVAQSPWQGAAVYTREQAQQAYETAVRLGSHSLPAARSALDRASAETGLRPALAHPEWGERLRLYEGVHAIGQRLAPEIYRAPLARVAAATGPRRARRELRLGRGERRRLRAVARSLWISGKPTRAELYEVLVAAERVQTAWARLRIDAGPPRLPSVPADAVRLVDEADRDLAELRAFLPSLVPGALTELEGRLRGLADDQETVRRLPRLYELRRRFAGLGLNPLLTELTRRSVPPELAVQVFDYAWYASILDHITVRDPRYSADRGNALDEIVAEFRELDTNHRKANSERVRRATAERLIAAQDRNPQQALVIRREARKQRRHLPLRRLLRESHDVLLDLKPCWAMSPLIVSQILPQQRLFDVVIFDEASQVTPADAIPSIMRARQVVVAGDPHQLPPSNFFRQVSEDPDDDNDDEQAVVTVGAGFESVLDTLLTVLSQQSLNWHYRSRDERLIAFSNAHVYRHTLTTFPGVFHDGRLRHVVVDQDPVAGQDTSVTAEVHRVVELIMDHARDRPRESLGVITLGIKHAERIESARLAALRDHPELEPFFAEDATEPFFVKNLERVQGDERDAIILSIGYGKSPDGRMRYYWGPLLRDGGERRLNVAVTRAKDRLTLVSSFSRHDVDPTRPMKPGARMLCDYLEYAGSGGVSLGTETPADVELNAFERDVLGRLVAWGIPVEPQYGVGGYRIDFAAKHPEQPGRMVLAIEADGAQYHSTPTARDRDRLRQEHLERLGWRFYRIWSTNWFADPETEMAKVRTAYERAVAAVDTGEPVHERPRRRPDNSRTTAQRSLPRPPIMSGLPITEYGPRQLVALVRWIESDRLPRTKDEVIAEAMAELGFQKRGSRIVSAITKAIDTARRSPR